MYFPFLPAHTMTLKECIERDMDKAKEAGDEEWTARLLTMLNMVIAHETPEPSPMRYVGKTRNEFSGV